MRKVGLDVLLEIFSEEIPSGEQLRAEGIAKEVVSKYLNEVNLKDPVIKVFSSPIRLVVHIKNLPENVVIEGRKVKGPAVNAPEIAMQKFTEKYGIGDVSVLEKIEGYWYYNVQESVVDVKDLVGKLVLGTLGALSDFWPKSLVWPQTRQGWIRPVRSILCVTEGGGELSVVDLEYCGVRFGNKTFGNKTFGLKGYEVSRIADYFEFLEKNEIVVDRYERVRLIEDAIVRIEREHGVKCLNGWLAQEVAGLCEVINPIEVRIEKKYLRLPSKVLISTISKNQKYFTFAADIKHEMSECVLIISNNSSKNDEIKNEIAKGNLRVLNARLEDAMFFYDHDLQVDLADRIVDLKGVNFYMGLGSVYDRMVRMKNVARCVGFEDEKVLKAIELCKTDITSKMVCEFTELQGYMGRIYGKAGGYDDDICVAIEDHYKPLGESDELPVEGVASLVALSDKIEKIISFWIVGQKPSSSKDPFGIRRDVLGVIRILERFNISLDLNKVFCEEFINKTHAGVEIKVGLRESAKEIRGFVNNRLLAYISARKGEYAGLKNIISAKSLFYAEDRVPNLYRFRQDVFVLDGFIDTLQPVLKRLFNTLSCEIADIKEVVIADRNLEKEEMDLIDFLGKIEGVENLEDMIKVCVNTGALHGIVSEFLDKCFVNHDVMEIRDRRLYLIKRVILSFSKFFNTKTIVEV